MKRFLQRIQDKTVDRSARSILLVAFGDSVTQGVGRVDQLLHDEVYHAQLKSLLEQRYPLCTFSVINAGVDGQTATQSLSRFGRDVAAHQPDLLLVAFGINDAIVGSDSGLDDYIGAIESLIELANRDTSADLILVTPNMMLTRDNHAIPARYRDIVPTMMDTQNRGVLARYAQALGVIAQRHGVMLADVYREWVTMSGSGVDTTSMLGNGLNHPVPKGHTVAAETIFRVIVGAETSDK